MNGLWKLRPWLDLSEAARYLSESTGTSIDDTIHPALGPRRADQAVRTFFRQDPRYPNHERGC